MTILQFRAGFIRRIALIAIPGSLLPCTVIGLAWMLSGCGMRSESERVAAHGSRIAIALEDVAQAPKTRDGLPRARINSLVAAPDGSHRLFINDMAGAIYILRNGSLEQEPFFDMNVARKSQFTSSDLFEQGLNTFAFHPDFARPGQAGFGKLYTFSTELPGSGTPTFRNQGSFPPAAHDDVIAEWRIESRNPDRVDYASRRELLRISHPLHDHVGGQIAFNPNATPSDADYGMLYIGVGDGGNTVFRNNQIDEWRTAQNKSLPLGKILRINPVPLDTRAYTIPKDNPLVGDSSALPEVWAYGLRNPERFSWDIGGTRKMFIADIGQAQLEEINVGSSGGNYGWSEREAVRTVNHGEETERLGLPIHDFF